MLHLEFRQNRLAQPHPLKADLLAIDEARGFVAQVWDIEKWLRALIRAGSVREATPTPRSPAILQ